MSASQNHYNQIADIYAQANQHHGMIVEDIHNTYL
jgi:hypothetical protein